MCTSTLDELLCKLSGTEVGVATKGSSMPRACGDMLDPPMGDRDLHPVLHTAPSVWTPFEMVYSIFIEERHSYYYCTAFAWKNTPALRIVWKYSQFHLEGNPLGTDAATYSLYMCLAVA